MAVTFNRLSRKFQTSWADVAEGIYKFKLFDENGYKEWDPEDFKRWFGTKKRIGDIVEGFRGVVMKKFRL